MSVKFNYGQLIVRKMRPLKSCDAIPMMGLVMYSEEDRLEYGIFAVEPYIKGDWEAPIEYKVRLVPVGSSSLKFIDHDFYTQDLSDTPEEMIFNELALAEKFLSDFISD